MSEFRPPEKISASLVGSTSATFTWENDQTFGVNRYELSYFATDRPGGQKTLIRLPPTQNSCTIVNLTPNTTYHVQLISKSAHNRTHLTPLEVLQTHDTALCPLDPHVKVIEENRAVLLRSIDCSTLFMVSLRAVRPRIINMETASHLESEVSSFKRNSKLLEWLEECSSEGFESFIQVLIETDQEHVANLLRGNDRDTIPMPQLYYDRIEEVAPKIIRSLVSVNLVVSELLGKGAITESDKDVIESQPSTNTRGYAIIEAIKRRSEKAFLDLVHALKVTEQPRLAAMLTDGIIFRYHVKSTLTSPQERETCSIVSQTSFQNLDDIQELEKKDVTIVNMEPGGSIIFYIHCRTPEAAKLCLEMHQSDRLKELLSRIMNEHRPITDEPVEITDVSFDGDDQQKCESFARTSITETSLKSVPNQCLPNTTLKMDQGTGPVTGLSETCIYSDNEGSAKNMVSKESPQTSNKAEVSERTSLLTTNDSMSNIRRFWMSASSNHNTGSFILMLMTVIVSFVLSLSTYFKFENFISHIFNVILMVLATIVILSFGSNSLYPSTYNGFVTAQNNFPMYLYLFGLTAFFLFSIFQDNCYVVMTFNCKNVWSTGSYEVTRYFSVVIAYHVMRMFFFIANLLFCFRFQRPSFQPNRANSYRLVIMIAANLSVLFDSMLLYDYENNSWPNSTSNLCNSSSDDISKTQKALCECQLSNTSHPLETIQPYLFPITIEFILIVCEMLFHKYFLCQSTELVPTDMSCSLPAADHTRLSRGRTPTRFWQTASLVFCFALNALIYCILASLSVQSTLQIYSEVFIYYDIFYYFLLTLVTLLGLKYLVTSPTATKSFLGFVFLTFISASGLIVQRILKLIATGLLMQSKETQKSGETLFQSLGSYLLLDFLALMQTILQLFLLKRCLKSSSLSDHFRRSRYSMIILSYLTICNFISWLVDTVTQEKPSPANIFYTGELSNAMLTIVLPFALFFRIYSALLFVRIIYYNKKGTNANKPRKRTTPNKSVRSKLQSFINSI